MINWRWFISSTVRQASEFGRRVEIILQEQRDLLSAQAIESVSNALAKLRALTRNGASRAEIKDQMAVLERVANSSLRPYASAAVRENVKEVLVALTIILAVTTFFIQLTKIPTGSLQPTLFGITYHNLAGVRNYQAPNALQRIWDYWVHGASYYEVIAQADGPLEIDPPQRLFPFVRRQRIQIGGHTQYVWFPPDDLFRRAGLMSGQECQQGELLLRMKVIAGDHLLVDRFTYNFRHPRRGEIIVFKTRGIKGLDQDVLYIKRLIGLPGDRVQILNNHHLKINGHELDASTPRFENVFTFDPRAPMPGHYFGYVNGVVAAQVGRPTLAKLFPDQDTVVVVQKGSYLAFGDNTLDSSDSRTWGPLPQENVTGRAWFVYWPITKRFGWGPW